MQIDMERRYKMIMTNENGIYDKEIEEYYCEDVGDLEVKIGRGLIPLVYKETDGDLLERISKARQEASDTTGIPIPKIRIRDAWKHELGKYEYSIKLRGAEVGRWTIKKEHTLYIVTDEDMIPEIRPSWEKTKEPAFGLDAYYIPDEEAANYESKVGFFSVSPSVVISTHLREIIVSNRNKFLNHYYVGQLVENVRRKNPELVSDLFIIRKFTITDLKLILNRLILEKVPINDMNTILETVADYLKDEDRPIQLAEKVRERLSLVNLQQYADEKKVLHVIKISQSASEILAEHSYYPEQRAEMPYVALDSVDNKKFRKAVNKYIDIMKGKDMLPIFLCVSVIRLPLEGYLERLGLKVICVSDIEIFALNHVLDVEVEGELSFDEKKQ